MWLLGRDGRGYKGWDNRGPVPKVSWHIILATWHKRMVYEVATAPGKWANLWQKRRVRTPALIDGSDDTTPCPPGKDVESKLSSKWRRMPVSLMSNFETKFRPAITWPTWGSICLWPVKRRVFVQLDVDGHHPRRFHEERMLWSWNWPVKKGLSSSCSLTISRVLISMPLEGGMWQYSNSSRRSETSQALCFFNLATSKCNLCGQGIQHFISVRRDETKQKLLEVHISIVVGMFSFQLCVLLLLSRASQEISLCNCKSYLSEKYLPQST